MTWGYYAKFSEWGSHTKENGDVQGIIHMEKKTITFGISKGKKIKFNAHEEKEIHEKCFELNAGIFFS